MISHASIAAHALTSHLRFFDAMMIAAMRMCIGNHKAQKKLKLADWQLTPARPRASERNDLMQNFSPHPQLSAFLQST